MADDDDDDEVAIEEGQEPETNDDGDPIVASGGPITAVIPVRKSTRPISDKVREVFAASVAKMKGKPGISDDEGGLESVDHEDAPQEPATPIVGEPAVDTAAQAAVVVAAPIAAPAATAPVPPAPSLDPEVVRLRSELAADREKFEQERTTFAQQARQTDIAKLRDEYFDKGAPAVVGVIKQWMPGLEGDELKREVADLIQDLAHQYLEAPLEDAVKDRITNKRVRAGLKTWKQEQERLEQERQSQLQASQESENKLRVKRILHQEVTKPEHASQFQWLSAEGNAGDLVFETIDQEHRKSGTQLTWQEAAKRVDDWLKQQSLAFYDKRKHLLSPPPTTAPADKQRAQGDKQVQHVTRAATPPKPEPPKAPLPEARLANQKWTPEQHRQKTMSNWRGKLQAQATDDE